MLNPVKPKRVYRSARREAQAATTRARLIDAARTHFVEKGWEATTIASVARVAGISAETVYKAFGNKAALFVEVVRTTVRGDMPDVPLLQQPGPLAVVAATDQAQVLSLFAADITRLLERVAPLMAAALGAAQTEAEIGALYRQIHNGRRENFRLISSVLIRNGSLKVGVSENMATDAIWRLTSPELFAVMTRYQGMSSAEYAQWLKQSLAAQILP